VVTVPYLDYYVHTTQYRHGYRVNEVALELALVVLHGLLTPLGP